MVVAATSRRKNRPMLRLSPTSMDTYLQCPRKFWFSRQSGYPDITDYPLLCGKAVHGVIEWLERKIPKEPRRFYYKDLEAAKGALAHRFLTDVQKAREAGLLLTVDDQKKFAFLNIGKKCVENYWVQNYDKAKPIEVESRYSLRLSNGATLVGVMDAVRLVKLETARIWRPELFSGDDLDPLYLHPEFRLPVVIVDFKTNFEDYDPRSRKDNPTEEDWKRKQFPLSELIQATTYCLLWYCKHGFWPLGFVWYHLRSGKIYFTKRDDSHFRRLDDIIAHVVDNIAALSFPVHPAKHCEWCPYLDPCNEDRDFYAYMPEDLGGMHGEILSLANLNVVKDPNKQLRMKLKAPRVKRQEPELVVAGNTRIIMRNLPWEDEEPIEEIRDLLQ